MPTDHKKLVQLSAKRIMQSSPLNEMIKLQTLFLMMFYKLNFRKTLPVLLLDRQSCVEKLHSQILQALLSLTKTLHLIFKELKSTLRYLNPSAILAKVILIIFKKIKNMKI